MEAVVHKGTCLGGRGPVSVLPLRSCVTVGEVLTFCGPYFLHRCHQKGSTDPQGHSGLGDGAEMPRTVGEGRGAGTLAGAPSPVSRNQCGPPFASSPSGLALPSLAQTTAVASIPPWVSLRRDRKPKPLTHPSPADLRTGPRELFEAWGHLSLSATPGLADPRVPQGELRISVLPAYLSYDAPWPVRKIPLRCTAHYVAYHVESKV